MRCSSQTSHRHDGNAAILAIVTLTLLAGLSMAHSTITRRNIQQSDFFLSRSELRRYAESGLATAFHHLTYNINDGQIGTAAWDPAADDLGRDGLAATSDQGEGDSIPTPGEPNLNPVSVGSPALGVELIVYVSDTAFVGVKRIVATSFKGEQSVTLEKQVQEVVTSIPRPGSVYVDPAVALDLSGSFLMDGNDTNPDGTPGPGPAQYGLSTAVGAVPGDNPAALMTQIDSGQYESIIGQGGEPSIGETTGVDIDALVGHFSSFPNQTFPTGMYSDAAWGDWSANDMVTTYVSGDLELSGTSSGAGVLIVDGNLVISGGFTFAGLIIVTGDVNFSGNTQVWGTVLTRGLLEISGLVELRYSSVVFDELEQTASQNAGYETVYYGEKLY